MIHYAVRSNRLELPVIIESQPTSPLSDIYLNGLPDGKIHGVHLMCINAMIKSDEGTENLLRAVLGLEGLKKHPA